MTLAEIRAALDVAFADMQTAHQEIDNAPEGTDLAPLEAQFSTHEHHHTRLRGQFDRAATLEQAQAGLPVVPDPTPGPDAVTDPPAQTPAPQPGQVPDPAPDGRFAMPGAVAGASDVRVGAEPTTYHRGGEHSFFLDAVRARFDGDPEARERLSRNAREAAPQRRGGQFAVSSVGTGVAGAAGDFVPPLYLQQEWIGIAQAARPFADAVGHMDLPGNTNVIIFPRLATGAAVSSQTDNTIVVSQDVSTGNVQVPVITIAGQQDISRQLLERSTPGFDTVLYQELTAKYHAMIDQQALYGPGTAGQMEGVLTNPGVNVVTYTDTAPNGSKLLPKINNAIQSVHSTRFLPPSLVVMHPRRWQWLLAAQDTVGRPLVTPYAPQNSVAQFDRVAAQGLVGGIAGLPVLVDPNIPITLGGAGGTQTRSS